LSLVGCISNSLGITNIFTLKLEDIFHSPSSLEIRIGYFGLCVYRSTQSICQSTSGKSAKVILDTVENASKASTPENSITAGVIDMALTLQSKHIVGLLAGAAVLFSFSLVFIALLKRNFKMSLAAGNAAAIKRRDQLRQASLTTVWLSVGFALASAIAVQQSTSALAYITQVEATSIAITAGRTLIL
ncbi:hypothetical protein DM02DRAFT_711854, partial [Periconia macrospinosa]